MATIVPQTFEDRLTYQVRQLTLMESYCTLLQLYGIHAQLASCAPVPEEQFRYGGFLFQVWVDDYLETINCNIADINHLAVMHLMERAFKAKGIDLLFAPEPPAMPNFVSL